MRLKSFEETVNKTIETVKNEYDGEDVFQLEIKFTDGTFIQMWYYERMIIVKDED